MKTCEIIKLIHLSFGISYAAISRQTGVGDSTVRNYCTSGREFKGKDKEALDNWIDNLSTLVDNDVQKWRGEE